MVYKKTSITAKKANRKLMYSKSKMEIKYLPWWLTASNSKGHGMHSPFVFDFIINVLNDDRAFYAFQQIENSYKIKKTEKKINRLLFKMVDYYQPKNITIIDNNDNIQTQYLAAANHLIDINSIKEFSDKSLQTMVGDIKKIDFVVCNNINSSDKVNLLEKLLSSFHNNSFFIVNKIHSSKDAEANWQSIQNNPSVKATIDLFHLGIVLFNPDFKVKQHFKVRF